MVGRSAILGWPLGDIRKVEMQLQRSNWSSFDLKHTECLHSSYWQWLCLKTRFRWEIGRRLFYVWLHSSVTWPAFFATIPHGDSGGISASGCYCFTWQQPTAGVFPGIPVGNDRKERWPDLSIFLPKVLQRMQHSPARFPQRFGDHFRKTHGREG